MTILVAPAGHAAARFACEKWHYSRCVPAGKLVKLGVWEDDRFIGVVLFSRGANSSLGSPYGLDQTQVCELTRVALTKHHAPVTQIVADALAILRRTNPGLRLVVSFADPEQGHHGGIYQAGGWIYTGVSGSADEYIVRGRRMHGRSARSYRKSHPRGGQSAASFLEWARANVDPNAKVVPGSSKHRYLMPLDRGMRRRIQRLALPNPPRVRSVDGTRQPSRLEGRVRPPQDAPDAPHEGVAS